MVTVLVSQDKRGFQGGERRMEFEDGLHGADGFDGVIGSALHLVRQKSLGAELGDNLGLHFMGQGGGGR